MDAIEKRARELLSAAIGSSQVSRPSISTPQMILNPEIPQLGVVATGDALNAITAALMLGGPVDLLNQDSPARVQAEERKVIPPSAFGADNAGSVGVDQVAGGFPGDVQLAEVASEHEAGVRPEGDGHATADHSAHNLEMVQRARERARFDAWVKASGSYGWNGFNRMEDMWDAWQAALTPPEGFVLVPVELPEEMEVAFMEAWASKRRCIDDPEMQDAWAAALAARPEVA